jgi:hypothetical protein
MFYCYDFEGSTKSLLFNFYLANYRILLAAETNSEINDSFPLIHFNNKIIQLLQDFIAPFFLFTKAHFTAAIETCDTYHNPKQMSIRSTAKATIFSTQIQDKQFEMTYCENAMQSFAILYQNEKKLYSCYIAN